MDTEQEKSALLLLLFYILGTVGLVPQYFYITANDYWMFKFRDLNGNATDNYVKTEMQKNFTAYYSNVVTVCTNVFLFLTIIFATKIPLQVRIIGSLSITMLLFFITLIFVWIDTDSWQYPFFIVSLTVAGLMSSTSGCFVISVYELSTKFPPVYLGTQLSGQALCGILAALIQILILLLEVSSQTNAIIYFSICAFVMVATIVFYLLVLYRSKYFQMHLNKEGEAKQNERIDFSKFKTVIRKLVMFFIILVTTAGSTVIIFPGVTSLIESTGKGTSRWSDVFFMPVCNYLLYHVFDFFGREFALRWIRLKNSYVILIANILRLGFIPLLMLCNSQPRNHLPVVFEEDYVFIIFMIAFAFTSGYFLNLCIMEIPSLVEPDEKALAVFITVIVMMISSASFSFLASVMVHAL